MTPDPFDISGKIALITGSSRGIGRGVAHALAGRGCHVIVSSRKKDACDAVVNDIAQAGFSAEAFACHIGREEDIHAIYEHIQAKHGRLDILVNNAVLSPWRKNTEIEPALFDKAVSVNLKGYWYMSVGAVPLMKSGGSIINISSVAARHPSPNLGLYSTLKAALDGMSRSFAAECGPRGIRVNTILPGLIDTELSTVYDDDVRSTILKQLPLGRVGLPDDIANAIVFLGSDASAYMTGASIVIDGGLTIANGNV